MRTKSIGALFIVPLLLASCMATQNNKPVIAPKEATLPWPWPNSMDAVSAAPKNHKVLYEDDRVRILDVTVEPGEKENMHAHRWPSILIVDSPAKKKEYTSDGEVISTDKPPAETLLPIIVRMGPAKPHAIENLDTNVLHLYRVELKKMEFKN
jgi:hypothetical protein